MSNSFNSPSHNHKIGIVRPPYSQDFVADRLPMQLDPVNISRSGTRPTDSGGGGGVFPWASVHSKKGGGGDPFRDTTGRPMTNVRQRQSSDALKEGVRDSPGSLNLMDKNECVFQFQLHV